ncbi:nitroreductase family protein, partial [Stomatobaculum longum]|uniref:nitroreductase family protein n=1 Tax=Stomatobaculum longum TaxID=796942 RepID=UPI0028809D96
MIEAIKARRSIRHFLPTPHSKEQLEEIVRAGMAAPSAKNLQPWHFVVTEGKAKERVCAAMEVGIERERHFPMLPDTRHYLDGAFETLRVMREAAALILITSPIARPLSATMTLDQRVTEICTAQSVGAAIENMRLQATALGIGRPWICDSVFAPAGLRAA